MSWERSPRQRSCPCNGDLLKLRRQERRWTQEDLADVTGFSVRLIAKAEAGGSLHPDTIEHLAAVLSTPAAPVFPEDLISSPKKLAAEFIAQLRRHHGQVVAKCQGFLADAIRFTMPGNPDILPFAGTHLGLDRMDQACHAFFNFLEPTNPSAWRTEFSVCEGTEVVTGHWVSAQLRGLTSKGVKLPENRVLVIYRMVFERGKIVTFDDHYMERDAEKEALKQQQLLLATG